MVKLYQLIKIDGDMDGDKTTTNDNILIHQKVAAFPSKYSLSQYPKLYSFPVFAINRCPTMRKMDLADPQ